MKDYDGVKKMNPANDNGTDNRITSQFTAVLPDNIYVSIKIPLNRKINNFS